MLLFDLLLSRESMDRQNVFDIDLLAYRLAKATDWLKAQPVWKGLPIGYFGASTGAAAALEACAEFQQDLFAVVSRGGRPDLAWDHLSHVSAPVLLIVGGNDLPVIELNAKAHRNLPHSRIEIIPGATHLFEEPGALEQVAEVACGWFLQALDQYRKSRVA